MNRNTKKLKRTHSKNNEIQSPTKRQFRNETEKRRRDLFTQLITNLKDILSIQKTSASNEENTKLDKASILRQAAAYLQKHHQNLTSEAKLELSNLKNASSSSNSPVDLSCKPPCDIVTNEEWLEITIESMNCFFLVIKGDLYHSQIINVSKNIKSYLGYSQDELIDHPLFQFILPSNHDRLLLYLLNNHQILETCDISWKRAFSEDYEQCTIIGAYRNINENEKYLMAIVKINTLDRTLITNIGEPLQEFITHINVQGRFSFIDSKARQYLGYGTYELIGQTFFHFVHPDDLPIVGRAHRLWKENGNGKSEPYRFLTKGQQWIFLQTSSQVRINSWTGKPESYICTTTILQCSNDSFTQQLVARTNNSNVEFPPTTTVSISSPSNLQDKSCRSSENEITSFLSNLRNDEYRKHIFEKLIERRQMKQEEIRVRQEEIQVVDDILKFINQYQIKHSNHQLTYQQNKEDIPSNVFDPNCDSNLFNIPLSDFSLQTNSTDISFDPLSLLFSPSSIAFNLSSPMTPFSNTDLMQDINYLSSTRTSSNDEQFPQHPFP